MIQWQVGSRKGLSWAGVDGGHYVTESYQPGRKNSAGLCLRREPVALCGADCHTSPIEIEKAKSTASSSSCRLASLSQLQSVRFKLLD